MASFIPPTTITTTKPTAHSCPTYTTTSTPLLSSPTFWLTESPVHDSRTGQTWFTDIPDSSIYHFSPTSLTPQTTLRKLKVDDLVGCIALLHDYPSTEKLLVGAKKGIAVLDSSTGKLTYLAKLFPEGQPDETGVATTKLDKYRINDGAVDSHGRFWVGTMRSFGLGPPGFEGSLLKFDPGNDTDDNESNSNTLTSMREEPVGVPNGISWSLDDKYLYFTDTKLNTIFRYDFDAATGSISQPQEWVKFTESVHGPGSPDGLDVDSNGDLWVAIFNGNKVLHLDGRTGEVKGKIEIPSSKQVACPRFVPGGLLITTGKLVHMDQEIGKSHSMDAGNVFFVRSEEIGGVVGGREPKMVRVKI